MSADIVSMPLFVAERAQREHDRKQALLAEELARNPFDYCLYCNARYCEPSNWPYCSKDCSVRAETD